MIKMKALIGLTKLHSITWSVLRSLSDQALVTAKKPGISLKVDKKPSRPPFMKNVFLGVFDSEILSYPELDKEGLAELKKKVEPYEEYFKENVDSKTLSALKMIPSENVESFKNLGLFGQLIPQEYGGCDQTAIETAFISEIIAKDLNIALTVYSHNFLGVQSLLLYGSSQQKEKYLPKLASGEWTVAFCMSESTGTSDLASIETKAVQSDDKKQYLLTGKKQWVINGNNTDLFIVLAKTDFRTHTGLILPNVRLILVERESDGVSVSPPHEHVGLNASNVSEVIFKDTPVHTDNFIGGETKGFEMCSRILNSGRYNIGAYTVTVLKNILRMASEFIANRRQFGKSLIESEHIQQKVTDIACCIYTLESMTYLTAAILDKYEDPDCMLELAIIKVFSFTEGRRCLDLLMELMGGRAFIKSEIFQKYFRDFRTMEVFDGTTDITNLFISLIGLQHAGETLNETVQKMRFPFEYPNFVFKRLFTFRRQFQDNPRLNLKLFEQLHPSLTEAANDLEYCVLRFQYAVAMIFNRYGADVVHQQLELMRLADSAVKIYAMTAVLGRSSRSYCIGLQNAETEVGYAIKVCLRYKNYIRTQLNDLIDGMIVSGDIQAFKLGPDIFRHHGYFVKHPLERSY